MERNIHINIEIIKKMKNKTMRKRREWNKAYNELNLIAYVINE